MGFVSIKQGFGKGQAGLWQGASEEGYRNTRNIT